MIQSVIPFVAIIKIKSFTKFYAKYLEGNRGTWKTFPRMSIFVSYLSEVEASPRQTIEKQPDPLKQPTLFEDLLQIGKVSRACVSVCPTKRKLTDPPHAA